MKFRVKKDIDGFNSVNGSRLVGTHTEILDRILEYKELRNHRLKKLKRGERISYLEDIILDTFVKMGADEYLMKVAKVDHRSFLALLNKLIPQISEMQIEKVQDKEEIILIG